MRSIDLTGPGAVLNAQAQSAARAKSVAEAAAFNAPAFQKLAEKGIKTETIDFFQIYKDKIRDAVDADGNGAISQAELAEQVQAGGGTASQASALYKTMDMNGDGTVSVEEFENSIPIPLNTFIENRNTALNMLQNGEKSDTDLMETLLGVSGKIDAGQVLGNLASGFTEDA